MTARIAHASAEAAEAFALLHAQSFPLSWGRAEFRRLLSTPGAFGLMVPHETPSAMLVGWVAADEAEILTLAVAPEARRRGFGRDLVKAAIFEAGRRGARTMFLEVAVDNAAAVALYEALGFRPAGRRKAYYRVPGQDPRDALILRFDLISQNLSP